MYSSREKTVAGDVLLKGISLHGGAMNTVKIKPAEAGSGIIFDLVDRAGSEVIAANPFSVIETNLGTRLANKSGASISTIEHLMAALTISGVSNALIAVEGDEIPILDGSASPFIDAIFTVGVTELGSPRSRLKVIEPVEVRDGERFIRIEPADVASLSLTIDFDDEAIGESTIEIDLEDNEALLRRLAPARTFCRLEDVEAMRTAGLARGGSLENAIVVDGQKILNENGLRDIQEFALHKALDLIGDIALVGAPMIGRITANKCGHDLNVAFAQALSRARPQMETLVAHDTEMVESLPRCVSDTCIPMQAAG